MMLNTGKNEQKNLTVERTEPATYCFAVRLHSVLLTKLFQKLSGLLFCPTLYVCVCVNKNVNYCCRMMVMFNCFHVWWMLTVLVVLPVQGTSSTC